MLRTRKDDAADLGTALESVFHRMDTMLEDPSSDAELQVYKGAGGAGRAQGAAGRGRGRGRGGGGADEPS